MKQHDPYSQWALDTLLRRFWATRAIDFLVELNEPVNLKIWNSFLQGIEKFNDSLHTAASPPIDAISKLPPSIKLTMPAAYLLKLPDQRTAKFVTFRMDVEATVAKDHMAFWREVRNAVEAVLNNANVARIQLGQPNYRWRDTSEEQSSDAKREPASANLQAAVVLGVLEDAIPFAHAALRATNGGSRVVSVWDQGRSPADAQWRSPDLFSYGAELGQADMSALITRHAGDEEAVYADQKSGRGLSPLQMRVSHGGMVLPLLAGVKNMPAPPLWTTGEDGVGLFVPAAEVEKVATTPILGVVFPARHAADRSGRWMAVNALDGLRHILSQADKYQTTDRQKTPIVVNLSYGALAGAHDGTSLLEAAIDELVNASQDRLAVVLAAGNHQGTRRAPDGEALEQDILTQRLPQVLPSELHARFTLRPEKSEMLTLFVPPDKQFETSLEIWMHRLNGEGEEVPLDETQKLSFKVTAPDGQETSTAVGMGGSYLWAPHNNARPANATAGLYVSTQVTQSSQRSMALLVVAATQVSRKYPSSAPGRWKVEITNLSEHDVHLDAYVERDDTAVGARRDQAARLVAFPEVPLTNEATFSDIATGNRVFRVGALQDIGLGAAGARVSPYSASDKAEGGPEFSALVDQGIASSGIRVSGSQSGMVVRANGTSLAAPQAARWIANELASTPSVTALRGKLPPGGTPRKGKKLLP